MFGDTWPVRRGKCLERIASSLPQREGYELGLRIAGPLTRRYRLPGSTRVLHPLQALAVAEAHDYDGAMVLLQVGEGKTDITFLLPTVLEAKRPLLVVPAAAYRDTFAKFEELGKHWVTHPAFLGGPGVARITKYSLISRRPELLEEYDPDVWIFDEAAALKNLRSGTTKRVRRALQKRPDSRVICLDASLVDRSFGEWWHLQQWCLPKEHHVLPYNHNEMDAWAGALDEKVAIRRGLGALRTFGDTREAVLEAYGNIVTRVPGIIVKPGVSCDVPLRVRVKRVTTPKIDEVIAQLRREWCTPGGEEFSEATELWRHIREAANGFYQVWDPPPPAWWLEPRRRFHAFVRGVLSRSRTSDTMLQVVQNYPNAREILEWREVRDEFKPNPVAHWFDETIVKRAAKFDGLVWCEHVPVGKKLDSLGLPYFGSKGLRKGVSIVDHDGPAALSVKACYKSFNLQYKQHRNLTLNAPPKGQLYEQKIGRTHRYGQTRRVYCELWMAAREQLSGFEQVLADAQHVTRVTRQQQKLKTAKVSVEWDRKSEKTSR